MDDEEEEEDDNGRIGYSCPIEASIRSLPEWLRLEACWRR